MDLQCFAEVVAQVNAEGIQGLYDYAVYPAWAFHMGVARPGLGNQEFTVAKGDFRSHPLTFYQVDAQLDHAQILDYLEKYYAAQQEADRQRGYESSYQYTTIEGNPAWWTLAVRDVAPPYHRGAVGRPVSQKLQDDAAASGPANQDGGDEPSTARGAVIIDGWVVAGSRATLDEVIDWTPPASLRENASMNIKQLLDDMRNWMDVRRVHQFQIDQAENAELKLHRLNSILYQALPVGWAVRKDVFDRVREDESLLEQLTRPQRLRYRLEQFVSSLIALEPRHVRVESFDAQAAKHRVGESWIFNVVAQRDNADDR